MMMMVATQGTLIEQRLINVAVQMNRVETERLMFTRECPGGDQCKRRIYGVGCCWEDDMDGEARAASKKYRERKAMTECESDFKFSNQLAFTRRMNLSG